MMDRPTIVTARLSLRRPDERDIGAIVGIVADWEVARRLARVPHPYGITDAEFFMEEVVPKEWVWAITLDGSDELVGAIGLTPEDDDVADLGYWLSRDHWGRGLMTEAAGAIVLHGFHHLGLRRITSAYFEDNHVSGQVLRKLGFSETGRTMRPCLALACNQPSVELVLLPDEVMVLRGPPT